MLRILLVIILLLPTSAFAATYHISPATGSPSGLNSRSCATSQTRATPKATLLANGDGAGALSCLSAGDTLIFLDGTYPSEGVFFGEVTWISGTSGNRITYRAENRNQAIIKSTVRWITTAGSTATGYANFDGVVIDTDGLNTGMFCGPAAFPAVGVHACYDITFENGTITDAGGCFSCGGMVGPYRNLVVRNNSFTDNGDAPDGFNHAFYLQWPDRNVIENNTIICKRNAGSGIDYRASGGNSGTGNIARNNYIQGCGSGIISQMPITIINNVIVDSSSDLNFNNQGIVLWFQTSGSLIANNTIFSTGAAPGQNSQCIRIQATAEALVITNNVCYLTSEAIRVDTTFVVPPVCTTNWNINGNGVTSSCGQTLGTTDPRFINAQLTGGNFRLCTGAATPDPGCVGASGAIDTGTMHADVDTDTLGVSRPQGKAFDIGAYEATAEDEPTRVSFATDNFTNAATALLSTYSAANYAIVYENGTANGVYVDAATDVAYGTPAWATGPWIARRADTGTGWLNDQYTSCQAVALPPTTPNYTSLIAVAVRVSTDTNANRDYLMAEMYGTGSGRCVSLQEVVNGVKSNLGNDCTTTWTTSDFLEIDAIGSTVRVLKNGTAILTATTTLTTGFPGIGGAGNVGSIVAALDNCDFGGFDDPLPPAGNITLVLPAASVVYQRPDPSVRIEWTTQNITGNVDLEYSLNNGVDFFPIATVGYNTSPYFWTANVPATVAMKVRVTQGAATDLSAAFTLRGQYLK